MAEKPEYCNLSDSQSQPIVSSGSVASTPPETAKEAINNILSILNLQPIAITSGDAKRKNSYGREKLCDIVSAIAPKLRRAINTDEKYEDMIDTHNKQDLFDGNFEGIS